MYNMLDKMAETVPEAASKWAVRLTDKDLKNKAINISIDRINQALKKENLEISGDWAKEDYAKLFFKDKLNIRGNFDFVMRDGKLEVYEIKDEGLINFISGMGPGQTTLLTKIPLISDAAAFSKRLLTEMVTKSPAFALYSNLLRDSFSAYNMGVSSALKSAPLYNVVNGLYHRMKNDKVYQDGMKYIRWSTLAKNENDAGKAYAMDMYKQLGFHQNQIVDNVKSAWGAYSHFLEHFEYASRIHEYNQLIKQGYSPDKAGYLAREVATDFSLKGSSGIVRDLSQFIPFFNAGIQGTYKLARTFADQPIKFWGKFIPTILAPSVFLWMYNSQDPTYGEIPDHIRDSNWAINTNTISKFINEKVGYNLMPYNPESKWYLFPKPYEIGFMGTIMERLMESIEKEDGTIVAQAFGTWFANMFRFNPVDPASMTPQLFKPFAELAKNETYGGRQIIPDSLVGLP